MVFYKKILIVGASRGLGRDLARFAATHLADFENMTLVARKKNKLDELALLVRAGDKENNQNPAPQGAQLHAFKMDMAQTAGQKELSELIEMEKFDLIIYSAGGGPHGNFSVKDFKDHQWALELGLIAPMSLVWTWLRCRQANGPGKFIIVGSRIAEQSADPQAASYAASKHGLFGFVSSLQAELLENQNKVWLFSPGYMDSEILPLTAKVRHDGSKLMSTETAAQALLRWVKKDEGPWHRVLN